MNQEARSDENDEDQRFSRERKERKQRGRREPVGSYYEEGSEVQTKKKSAPQRPVGAFKIPKVAKKQPGRLRCVAPGYFAHTFCVLPQCSLQACHARAQTAHGPRFIPRYLLSGSPTIDITYDGSWTGITQGLNGNKEHMQGLIANRRVRHPGVDSSGVRFILVHLNTHINCINTLQCSVPTK